MWWSTKYIWLLHVLVVLLLVTAVSWFNKTVSPLYKMASFTPARTIRDFGYDFNAAGQLRQLDKASKQLTDNGFVFGINDKHSENQKNYEALGDAITDYVYDLLETKANLKRLPVPVSGKEELRSFIFTSDDALTNTDKLMILIHGSGVVRAGQWSRSLIVNDNIETGTQLPYIEKAKELGYGILVLNTNDNQRIINGKQFLISQSSTPEEHANSVYEEYIKNCPAKFIVIVAHSYGGVVTVGLAQKYPEFLKSVARIAMTDSVHSFRRDGISSNVEAALQKIGRNWVSSHDPLDTPQKSPDYEISRVSAGHPKHEMTSHAAFASVFEFFEKEYRERFS